MRHDKQNPTPLLCLSLGCIIVVSFASVSPDSPSKIMFRLGVAHGQRPGVTDMDAFTKRNRARQATDERAFNKQDADLKRATSGICSNC